MWDIGTVGKQPINYESLMGQMNSKSAQDFQHFLKLLNTAPRDNGSQE